jgi:hypothetical protein
MADIMALPPGHITSSLPVRGQDEVVGVGWEAFAHRLGGVRLRERWAAIGLVGREQAGTGRLEERAVDDALLEGVWGPTVHRLVIDCTGTSFRLTVRRGERP